MMYRSGWATKHNQECTLAVWIKRVLNKFKFYQTLFCCFLQPFFETLLRAAESTQGKGVRGKKSIEKKARLQAEREKEFAKVRKKDGGASSKALQHA